MRSILLLTGLFLATLQTTDSKRALICHTWRLIGIKPFGKDYAPTHTPEDEVMTLHDDGTIEKLLYGQMKMTGRRPPRLLRAKNDLSS